MEKQRKLREEKEAENARLAAEAKEKRRKDLQARLGSRQDARDQTATDYQPERKRRRKSYSPEPRGESRDGTKFCSMQHRNAKNSALFRDFLRG